MTFHHENLELRIQELESQLKKAKKTILLSAGWFKLTLQAMQKCHSWEVLSLSEKDIQGMLTAMNKTLLELKCSTHENCTFLSSEKEV